MKFRKFSDTGWNISEVGLGCWQIGWSWGDVSDDDARSLLKEALNNEILNEIESIHSLDPNPCV